MSETQPLGLIPQKVWVIVRNTHTNMYDSKTGQDKRYPVLAKFEGGFYLLEADALAYADDLNKDLKEAYVKDCKEREADIRRLEDEQTAWHEANERWLQQHATEIQAGRIPSEPGPTHPPMPPAHVGTFEDWLVANDKSWHEAVPVRSRVDLDD